jgi:outer membrane protein assembly factor BamB
VIGSLVYYSTLSGRRTYALSAKTGRQVWSLGRGAFNPAISDGIRVYITGYSSVYAFTTPRQLRRERRAAAAKTSAARKQQRAKTSKKTKKKS